jgi:prepilin-type N-terminal cleavage/methylation domain-containing protein
MRTIKAFSLIELSIVILIVGIIVAGVTQSSSLVRKFKLGTARNLTQGSPIHGVKDLIVWLDASSEASIGSLGDGDPVTDWKDINTHSLTKIKFTQSDDLSKPTYKENGINGVPSISFSSGFLTNTNFPATSANYSAFIVFNKVSGVVGSQDLFSIYYDSDSNHSNSTAINGVLLEVTGGNFMRSLYRSDPMGTGGGDSNVSALKIGNDSGYILSYVRNLSSGSEKLWMNNSIFINAVPTKPFFELSPVFAVIGKLNDKNPSSDPRFFVGQISEIIFFDRALTTEEVDSIEDYLSKKYSIKLN